MKNSNWSKIVFQFIFLSIYLTLTACEKEEIIKKTYEPVPMAAVLANPKLYAGKKVELVGYISIESYTRYLIFMSKQSMLDGQIIDAIRFSVANMGGGKKYLNCSRSFVSISGTLEERSTMFTVDLILTKIVDFRVIKDRTNKCPSWSKPLKNTPTNSRQSKNKEN